MTDKSGLEVGRSSARSESKVTNDIRDARILVLAPHTDDGELGAGGRLISGLPRETWSTTWLSPPANLCSPRRVSQRFSAMNASERLKRSESLKTGAGCSTLKCASFREIAKQSLMR